MKKKSLFILFTLTIFLFSLTAFDCNDALVIKDSACTISNQICSYANTLCAIPMLVKIESSDSSISISSNSAKYSVNDKAYGEDEYFLEIMDSTQLQLLKSDLISIREQLKNILENVEENRLNKIK